MLPKFSVGSNEEQARNLVIEGDNLQAMVTLYRERGQVDLILTDPPFNTGNDFRYNDKWEDDPNDPGLGEFVSPDDGARHTKWIRFMWPRLQMMKAMLKPSGVLAVCIDQRELFHLGQMLDELFLEKNRLAIINWQRSYSRTNDAMHVATTTEYVVVYARDALRAKTGLIPKERTSRNGARNLDLDPEPWVDAPATASNARLHKSMVYGIQSPFTGEVLYPPIGSAWRLGQARNLEYLRGWGCRYELRDLNDAEVRARVIGIRREEVPDVQGIVLGEPTATALAKAQETLARGVWPHFYFLKDGLGRPRIKKMTSTMKQGEVPATFWASETFEPPEELGSVSWAHAESGHSQQGVDELTAIVGEGHEFKTVKPLKLMQKIIDLWCPAEGLVLDPFAGTGTTAHELLSILVEKPSSKSSEMSYAAAPSVAG